MHISCGNRGNYYSYIEILNWYIFLKTETTKP